jgi:flagellar basal-body rod modification protein FlgD
MEAINFESSTSSINSAAANNVAANKSNDELSQSDFVELLVAQVKNQDPTKPMDPSQFMNQLTQSSMVNGINDLQKSFDSLATKLSSDQSLQAAGLVGKSVLLAGGETQLAAGGSINGQFNLEQATSDVKIMIFNRNEELVKTLPLSGDKAGELLFKWDGIDDSGSAVPEGEYLVTAQALINGEQQAMQVSLETHIDSISLNNSDGTQAGTLLNLASGQTVTLGEIQAIK